MKGKGQADTGDLQKAVSDNNVREVQRAKEGIDFERDQKQPQREEH